MITLSTELVLTLLELPSIGRKTAIKLIRGLSYSVSRIEDMKDWLGEAFPTGKKIQAFSAIQFNQAFGEAKRILEGSEKKGINTLTFLHPHYPTLLKQSLDPPPVLYYKGNIQNLNALPGVAIIGTREPTHYGLERGEKLGSYFAEKGFNIISGLAKGCDAAGHRGALQAKGITTAVMGQGLDKIYPKENTKLAQDILDGGGAWVSEYHIFQPSKPSFFVERDRIQAGLSLGVIVVETDIQGGTMHTVQFCQDYHRILGAIGHPANLLSEPKSQGNQQLLRNKKALRIYSEPELKEFLNRLQVQFQSGGENQILHTQLPDIQKEMTIPKNKETTKKESSAKSEKAKPSYPSKPQKSTGSKDKGQEDQLEQLALDLK
jgi:DNA processing protein